MATTLDRKAIEGAMGESWLARFLKFGKSSRSFNCYARTAKAKRVVLGAESVATTLDRKAIEAAMGESWLARFLKFGKPSRSFSCYARTAKAKRAA